jgi:3-(3-hydroxy-phenyl)propionate hydroxylase
MGGTKCLARTIEVLDQRGIADRFLAQGQAMQVAGFAHVPNCQRR